MKHPCWLVLALVCVLAPAVVRADSALGDWGHFLQHKPRILLNNPDGKAFTVTLHVMRWPVESWNKPVQKVRLTAPGGTVIHDGDCALTDAEAILRVPAGGKGVYRLEAEGQPFWVSTTLDQAVLWTGDPTKDHVFRERFAPVFLPVVRRQWCFFVPAGVTKFTCKAQRSSEYMSQREDWGIFVLSPRGQRLRALWGQPAQTPAAQYRQDMTVEVEVEPGAGGRFWALEMGLGDSHQYSKPNICFDGIPPYLARSPEEWFDPETGRAPAVKLYDDDPFIQAARIEDVLKARWPNLQHFSPCPSLGDPDGCEVLGDATFALWNPEGRALGFRIGTYLPRQPKEKPALAQVTITGADGKAVFSKPLPLLHIHGSDGMPTETITPAGVSRVAVSGVERWFAFTYPATPLVLLGQPVAGGWQRFRLSNATARNWYFSVPRGTREFAVRVAADTPGDVVHLEVCAPDRTLAVIYDQAGERTITVPPGLDGKRWHLRVDTGSAARLVTQTPPYRYQDLCLSLELKGVPGALAPTWEQWFDPTHPPARSATVGKTGPAD
jgi:hypothetical protein